ncbi:hypothetical protein HK102_006718 [Quaeritorhiza haematococci]|nr:hypothetical protein HK102_006718 [Quaeritorhiza haematococci]
MASAEVLAPSPGLPNGKQNQSNGASPETSVEQPSADSIPTINEPAPSNDANGILQSSSQTSLSMFGNTTNLLGSTEFLMFLDEDEILKSPTLTDEQKKAKVTSAFIRSASNGDITKVQSLLADKSDWIDKDGKDEDGTTALIYACCFGHSDVAHFLLEKGAKVDEKDKHGWTALLWACSNGHDEIARMLLDFGADKDAKSNRGRTIRDLVSRTSSGKAMAKILDFDKSPVSAAHSSTPNMLGSNSMADGSDVTSASSPALLDVRDDRYVSDTESIESDHSRTSSHSSKFSLEELGLYDDTNGDAVQFDWDKCSLDQMFVFNERDVDHILDVAITRVRPTKSAHQRPVAANVLFLCARYAHYYNSSDLLKEFFAKAIDQIIIAIQRGRDDLSVLAYWIANSTQLLYYLKKDMGLVVSTFEAQLTLQELIHELCNILIKDTERRILSVVDAALLDHSSIDAPVKFENVITGLGRRKTLLKTGNQKYGVQRSPTRRNHIAPPTRSAVKQPYQVSPKTVTSIFSSTHFVLQSNNVHRSIIYQIFQQLFHFLGAELFNRIITNREYCCRSRAIQIRMNISLIEEWIRENIDFFPPEKCPLTKYLRSVIHLTQFLQVISSVQDLGGFLETMSSLEALTLPQVHKAMETYKYEVGEASFPEEVEAYVQKVIEDLARQQEDRLLGRPEDEDPSAAIAKRASMDALQKLEDAKRQAAATTGGNQKTANGDSGAKNGPLSPSSASTTSSDEDDEAEPDDLLSDMIDPQFKLPFHIPTLSGGREDEGWTGTQQTPFIPDDVMKMLDNNFRVMSPLGSAESFGGM